MIIIFRIVQVALLNVVNHTKATMLELNVHYSIEQMKLTISDNGTGLTGTKIRIRKAVYET